MSSLPVLLHIRQTIKKGDGGLDQPCENLFVPAKGVHRKLKLIFLKFNQDSAFALP